MDCCSEIIMLPLSGKIWSLEGGGVLIFFTGPLVFRRFYGSVYVFLKFSACQKYSFTPKINKIYNCWSKAFLTVKIFICFQGQKNIGFLDKGFSRFLNIHVQWKYILNLEKKQKISFAFEGIFVFHTIILCSCYDHRGILVFFTLF